MRIFLFLVAVFVTAFLSVGHLRASETSPWPEPLRSLYAATTEEQAREILSSIKTDSAADKPAAMMALGRLHYLGDFVLEDAEKAEKLLTAASEVGQSFASWTLAMLFRDRKDTKAYIEYLMKAADQGDARAAFWVFFEQANPVTHTDAPEGWVFSLIEAEPYLDQAVEAGHPDALRVRAYFDYLGAQSDDERSKALAMLRKAMAMIGAPLPLNLDPLDEWRLTIPDSIKAFRTAFERQKKILEKQAESGWSYAAWQWYQRHGDYSLFPEKNQNAAYKLRVRKFLKIATDSGYPPAMMQWGFSMDSRGPSGPPEGGYIMEALRAGATYRIDSIGFNLFYLEHKQDLAAAWFMVADRLTEARSVIEVPEEARDSEAEVISASLRANVLMAKVKLRDSLPLPDDKGACKLLGPFICR